MIDPANFPLHDLPLAKVYEREKTHGNHLYLTQPVKGELRHWTWAETVREARQMANHLLAQGWPPGSHIVILSKNCAWWFMAELAIWMAGHVTVPIYPSLSAPAAQQLFEHCEPVACFIGPVDSPNILSDAIPAAVYRIRFPNASPSEGVEWNQILATTAPLATNPERRPDEIATIIYTSGTTGSPKGAMHLFVAFPYFAKAIEQIVGNGPQKVISYLPLAHIAERALTETSSFYFPWHVFFTEGLATFQTDLKRARVTIFFSVPRLYTKFQQGVFERIAPDTLQHALHVPIARSILGTYILRQLGLGYATCAASGSAALAPDVLNWFRGLGLNLVEGYGTTESGISHTAPNGESHPGYVGCSAPGVETKLSEDHEILLRSPMNMAGYYKNPDATREAFTDDGFFRTGDLGEIDESGWLKISGRIKDKFKTSKGKYVSPALIEGLLSAHPAVEHALVLGAGLPAPFALIVLAPGASPEGFEHLIETTNEKLEPHEQLSFVVLTDARWTVENGLITPTLKLKRTPLEAMYMPFVPAWTAENKRVVWHLTNQPQNSG